MELCSPVLWKIVLCACTDYLCLLCRKGLGGEAIYADRNNLANVFNLSSEALGIW